jgi:serine/threonine-protein kinase
VIGKGRTVQELGKYEIVDEIGRGSYGVVYRAHDTALGREIALKVLHPQFLADQAFVKRFQREAQAMARLDHPNIVTVYDAGENAGQLYIAMKLACGASLAAAIADRGRFPWQETLALLDPICRALDYAHSRGVVHRDLKPSNILLDEERGPMLADFGIARLVGASTASLTVTGGVVGTPAYIAPEVWGKAKAKAPADIYALGCIVYEMLTGEVLFSGAGVMQVIGAHYRGPEFPAQWPDGVPGGVESILGKALAREPKDRFDGAGEMTEALREVMRESAEREVEMGRPLVAGRGVRRRSLAGQNVEILFSNGREKDATPSPTKPFEPEMLLIPAGEFLMGSDLRKDMNADDNEQPQHELYLPGYYIARTPVTNAQYLAFVQDAGWRPPDHWKKRKPPKGKETHPVDHVSWSDAIAYCKWLSEATGKPFRLPTEAEWEKAARGTDGGIYPWGNQWDAERCNNDESGIDDMTPVGKYSPEGDSPYGCADMAGNVREWTSSLYKPYPYDVADGREDLGAEGVCVLRGGEFDNGSRGVRCAARYWNPPDLSSWGLGFRVVVSPG